MSYKRLFLKDHVSEWKNMYIRYSYLKRIVRNRGLFERELLKDVTRVNDFYFQLEKEAVFQKNRLSAKQGGRAPERGQSEGQIEENGGEQILKTSNVLQSDCENGRTMTDVPGSGNAGSSSNKSIPAERSSASRRNAKPAASFFAFLSVSKHYDDHRRNQSMMEFVKFCKNIKSFQAVNKYGIGRLVRHCKCGDTEQAISRAYIMTSSRIDWVLRKVRRMCRKNFDLNRKKVRLLFNRISQKRRPSAVATFFAGILMTLAVFACVHIVFRGRDTKIKKPENKSDSDSQIGNHGNRDNHGNSDNAGNTDIHGEGHDYASIDINPLFFAGNYLFLGFFLFGVCLLVFDYKNINSEFIFGFDLTSNLDTSRYFFLLSIFMFMHNWMFLIGSLGAVTICLLELLVFMLPFDFLYYRSRFYLIFTVFKIVTTPMFSVKFKHFFVADCVTSYSSMILRVVNFYLGLEDGMAEHNNHVHDHGNINKHSVSHNNISIGFCVSLVPSFIRLLQCMRRFRDTRKVNPHLFNALKYLAGITYAAVSFYGSEGLARAIGACYVLYALFWDFIFDWGLLHRQRLFHPGIYLVAVACNTFGRIAPVLKTASLRAYLLAIEIARRFLWAIFRVEIEHLNNCDKLKTSKFMDISNPELFYRRDLQGNNLETTTGNDEASTEPKEAIDKIYV